MTTEAGVHRLDSMERWALGLRLQSWHSSSGDPIYAVGSYYFSDTVYPQKDVVEDALRNLRQDLEQNKKMLAGEKVKVYNQHYGRMVEDLRAFAGYKDAELQDNIADLEEIIQVLGDFIKKDYPE